MDELQNLEFEKQGKYTVERFADKVAFMSIESVRRYLRQGPEYYPDRWKDLGVNAYKLGKRFWIIEMAVKPDELAAGYAVRTLPLATTDTVQKLTELVNAFEERLPITEVFSTFEKRLPLENAATQVKRFIKETPPPNKVLDEISRTFIRK